MAECGCLFDLRVRRTSMMPVPACTVSGPCAQLYMHREFPVRVMHRASISVQWLPCPRRVRWSFFRGVSRFTHVEVQTQLMIACFLFYASWHWWCCSELETETATTFSTRWCQDTGCFPVVGVLYVPCIIIEVVSDISHSYKCFLAS